MKKMVKSVVAAVGVVTLAVLTAACGDQSAVNQPATASSGNSAAGDTMKKIKDRGEVVFGVKYNTAPFGYIDQGETQPKGFDIDLATEVAKRIGAKPKFVEVTTQNRIPNLQSGKIDIIAASMIATRTRAKTIDFSEVYFSDDQRLMVRDDSTIANVGDLAGKTVALVQGGNEEPSLRKAAPAAKVLSFQSWPEALQALLRGDAEALSTTTGILSGLEKTATQAGKHVKVVGDGFARGPVAMGVRQGDSVLRNEINAALMSMVDDGTYAQIFNKWWNGILPRPYNVEVWPTGT
jgi:ABC-type amino acid transport substrate-binding protein